MPVDKINVGLAPNDGTGDNNRDAWIKANAAIDQINTNTAAIEGNTSALSNKVDKVSGKGLSTNDFTNDDKALVDQVVNKVDKVAGKGLSTNDFTDAEQEKLAGLEGSHYRGLFVSLAALQAAIPTANPGDYADVDGGAGEDVARYIWDSSDSAWVFQGGSASPITAAQVKTLYESNPDTNAFTDAQESKLAGIEAGAQVNLATNLSIGTRTTTTVPINSSTGAAATFPSATTSLAGAMSSADKTKLDGVAAGATANSSDATLLNRANHTGTQAIGTIADLQSTLDAKALSSDLGFTIVYPNGGSAASPANVAVNSRYVMANPFPGSQVLCIAEVQVGGVWGESGWAYSSSSLGGYGVKASQSSTDGIVVQTGFVATVATGRDSGGSFTFTTGAVTTPVPCRVKVWKLKGNI